MTDPNHEETKKPQNEIRSDNGDFVYSYHDDYYEISAEIVLVDSEGKKRTIRCPHCGFNAVQLKMTWTGIMLGLRCLHCGKTEERKMPETVLGVTS